MQAPYVAYGLALRTSFRLPGMQPLEDESLPALELELTKPVQLATLWSGAAGPPIWRGQLGDGRDLTIERGVAGDLLFSHRDRARFRLARDARSLACAPLRASRDWQRTLVTKVLPTISVIRGYEALHASAVDSPWGAVAIAAPAGIGKTTLALELVRRGWRLLTDDVLTFTATPAGPLAYPGTPHVNIDAGAGAAHVGFGATLQLARGERWLAVRVSARQARPVNAICLLSRAPGLRLAARVLSPSPLALAPFMLGLPGDAERERRRFERYAELSASAALIALSAPLSARPNALADLIERRLAPEGAMLASAGAR